MAELVTATGDVDNSALGSVNLLDSADVLIIGNNSSSGTAVFDTLDSLPTSNLSAGQQAFVNENERLYISNGSGWYNLTFVNRTPTWLTEPDATYEIADSVTPLIVTAKATDSDNADTNLLNQSVVSDSAQYMVNITSDSSVFTFTPKSADSIGIEVAAGNLTDSNGDFVYTFKWSDGINFVAKSTTISYNPSGGGSNATPTGFFAQTKSFDGYSSSISPASREWPTLYMVKQAPDGNYYAAAYENYNNAGSMLMKFDENGTFGWVKAWENSYAGRAYDIAFNGNNPVVITHDHGYGYNYSGYTFQTTHIQEFNSSGTRQDSKIFRNNTINSNYAHTGSNTQKIVSDSYGNLWFTFVYNKFYTTPVNLGYSATGLARVSNSGSGYSLDKVYILPGTGLGTGGAYARDIHIDGDSMYLCLYVADPNNTSYPHGALLKLTLTSNGSLSYNWAKLYGQFSGSAHYDVPGQIYKTSDGNVIVGGYTQQSNVNNTYYPTLMKFNDSTGDIIWKKRYDSAYGQYEGKVSMVTPDDRIFMAGHTYNTGTSHYEFWLREVSSSDGSHVDMWEIDFDGIANVNVDNAGYTWQGWRLGDPFMEVNKDGNLILGMTPNGNGFDYRPSFAKLPSDIITGTFGGGGGTYSGNLIISDKNVTPTDYTYDASILTYASWSTVSDYTSSFQLTTYNSGTHNDNLITPTLTHKLGAIS